MLTNHAAAQSLRTSLNPDPALIRRASMLSSSVRDSAAIVLAKQGAEYVIAIVRRYRVTTFMARRVSQFELGDRHNAQAMRVNQIIWSV